ncbi:MAG: hypothetical protein KDB61_13020 [Planctomycetes bacterium]|nr:hypothetical protein [Planctomycetota bacterium]
MKLRGLIVLSLLAPMVAGCVSQRRGQLNLASARVVADFDSYHLRRVGLMPINGLDRSMEDSPDMPNILAAEFAAATGLEVLVLDRSDLTEVKELKPHERGEFNLQTIIDVGKRHRLDGLLVATLTEHNVYPPQRIGMQMDFVSTETGISLWYGSLAVDACSTRTQNAVHYWTQGEFSDHHFDDGVVLISPLRFFRFACAQLVAHFTVPAASRN